MFRLGAFVAVLVSYAAAANDPVREVTSQAAVVGQQPIPAFYKGYVYWAGENNPASVYTPDGQPGPYITTPNGPVESIAADTDGTLAIAWGFKLGGGIDLRDPSGALLRTIRTGRYLPTHIAFGEDHSLWSLGWQLDPAEPRPARSDYMTVRKYLANGQEAGAYLPRSLFPRAGEPGEQSWQRSCITVGKDRVGLWVLSGSSEKTEWVELDLSGNLTGRWRLDQFTQETRVALTADGHVFVQNFDVKSKVHLLYILDRGSSAWQLLGPSPSGWLASADGDALVFFSFGGGPVRLGWYPHP